MKYSNKELVVVYRAVRILEHGEELLGMDLDKKNVSALASKIKHELPGKIVAKVDKEIKGVIEESKRAFEDYAEDNGPYDFDETFGPSYPTTETVKVLNRAIEKQSAVKINYFSLSQGKFTERVVEPESIERKGGKLYLNAFCRLRGEGRVFRVDRIKHIKKVDG